MKKIFALLAVIVLVFSIFTACRRNEDAEEAEPITLNLWHWNINMQEQYEAIFEEFYRQTGHIVQQTVMPWSDYWPNLATALPAGNGPDIFWMNHLNAVSYMPTGLLKNLDDFELDMSGFKSPLYEPFMHNGSLFGIPLFYETIALLYNKDVFDVSGVAYPPRRGWTWEEMRETANLLTERVGDITIRYGISFGTGLQAGTNNFIWQNGGEFMTSDGSAFTFNTPQALEAMQFWHDLIWEDQVALNPNNPAWGNYFLNGLSAMEIHGIWRVALAYEYLGDRLGVAHLPMKTQEANTVHGIAHVFNANTRHTEAVQQFMEFTASRYTGDLFAPVFLPAYTASQHLWFANFPDLPQLVVFAEAVDIARPLPVAAKNAGNVWSHATEELSRIYQLSEITMEALREISESLTAMIHE